MPAGRACLPGGQGGALVGSARAEPWCLATGGVWVGSCGEQEQSRRWSPPSLQPQEGRGACPEPWWQGGLFLQPAWWARGPVAPCGPPSPSTSAWWEVGASARLPLSLRQDVAHPSSAPQHQPQTALLPTSCPCVSAASAPAWGRGWRGLESKVRSGVPEGGVGGWEDLSSGGARRLLLPGSAPVLETGLAEHGPRTPAVPTQVCCSVSSPFPWAESRAPDDRQWPSRLSWPWLPAGTGVRGCQGPSVRLGVHMTH